MAFIKFLLNQYEILQRGSAASISSICSHSDKAKPSALFIALKGQRANGHCAIKKAIQNGASALLVEDSSAIPPDFKGLALKYHGKQGLRLPRLLNCFYKNPSQKLFTVGVTGSNGKTTFCFMLEHIFKKCGWATAVIGTVDRRFQDYKQPAALTTPDPVELFKATDEFVRRGAKALIMEVSSIGLDQGRVEGIDFNGLVFTNLSQDHLDYHKDMEDYFSAKKKLFALPAGKGGPFQLVNKDDRYGQRLAQSLSFSHTYGAGAGCDFLYKIKNRKLWSSDFVLRAPSGSSQVSLPVPGDHNVSNAVAALAGAVLTGFSLQEAALALSSFPGTPGRWQRVCSKALPYDILIDYAHTPAALRAVLKSLRALYNKKLLLVFGCGGDRDKGKRPQMMKEALQRADKIFFTSDNPRFESAESIIQDSFKNISKEEKRAITVEWDRKKAIKKALQLAGPGDCVLIAGKGHEAYQIKGDKKIPFCDVTAVRQSLCEIGLLTVPDV